jgi:CheY-like chemotaxis protein
LRMISETDRGTRFLMQAKLAGIGAVRTAQAERNMTALAGVPVLVVDDDPLAREAIAGALHDLGAVVRSGANEAEGAAVLAEGFLPRLLLMDLRIDGALVGVEIARGFRARIEPPPRVIIITGDTGPETLTLLRNSSFAWLIKPVSPRALSEVAAEQLAAA